MSESTESMADAIIRFIDEHPGCTSSQIGRALGGSSAQRVATLFAQGRVWRRVHAQSDLLWHYYSLRHKPA